MAAGLALVAAFAWWELRAKQPMLDVRLFSRPAFGISALTLTLVFFTLMGLFFSIAQLFQLVMGYGAFEAVAATGADLHLHDGLAPRCRRSW